MRSARRACRRPRRRSSAACASSRPWRSSPGATTRASSRSSGRAEPGRRGWRRRRRPSSRSDYPDGVHWVPLADLRDPAQAAAAVAEALDVATGPGCEDAIAAALDHKRALVVVDNAEHLLPDVADTIGKLVSVVGPTILVTSRELLRLHGEHVFDVSSLAERDAEELFLSRARAIDPAFAETAAVAELCRRLDQLPLAIELAAAHTADFTADELLDRVCERLDLLQAGADVDPRQQTLRATMEWSHELLDGNEQRLFARLSVFESGCSLETAEQVCDADLETLQGLLDKSFLPRRAEDRMPRFSMLGTIRDYGRERLAASGEEEAVRERHAGWVASLAERIPLESAGARFDAARSEVVEERAEVRAALRWTRETGRTELSLRIGAGLTALWPSLFLAEAEAWLDHAVQAAADVPPPLRARVLRTCGTIAFFVLADVDRAVGLLERALELADEAGDERLAALIRYRLDMAAWDRGDAGGAVPSLERALADARARGDRPDEITTLHHLGEAVRDAGEFGRAEALLLESIALARSAGDVRMADETIHSLGDLNLDRGTLDQAAAQYAESLRAALRRSEERSVAYCVAGIACVLLERGVVEEAATLWGAVEATERRAGFRMLDTERARYSQRLDRLAGSAAWEAGRALPLQAAARRALASID